MNEKNQIYSERAHRLIPGGAHTYSKGDDQFPANAPKIISRGNGCRIWDVDDNSFLDLGMSLGTVTLGHAYEPILEAVRNELVKGVNFVRPSIIEGELAEIVTELIPCAEMVKFAKNGSDAVTASIKLARAYTGRDMVARCSSDPFNAVHDWFIGSTIMNRGVPSAVRDMTLQFHYNDLDSVRKIFDENPGKIACLILEPISMIKPEEGFLQGLKDICEKEGALLIFDEVVSGFRFALGGAQEVAGVTPHIAAFGKAMANGFSVSALVGKREVMELGGINHDSERVFLLSTTHGGETHSLAASIATIKEIKEKNIIDHFYWVGNTLMDGVRKILEKHNAQKYVSVLGYGCKPGFGFNDVHGKPCMHSRTFFLQEMVKRNVMIPYVVPSFAHKESDLNEALVAFEASLLELKRVLENETIEKEILGSTVKPVFRKMN
jgi:glutamate-1-semialdehyde 2,1-aminomutase